MKHLRLMINHKNAKCKSIASEIKRNFSVFQKLILNIELEKSLIGFDAGQEGSPWFVKITLNLEDGTTHTEYLYFVIRSEAKTIKQRVEFINTHLKKGINTMKTVKDALLYIYPGIKHYINEISYE